MQPLKNNGQVLTTFVLLLPIFILIIAITIDLGLFLVDIKTVQDNIKEVIEYALNTNDEDRKQVMEDLLEMNLKDKNYKIDLTNNVKVTVTGDYNSIFKKVFDKTYKYTYTYIGDYNTKEIKKEG